MPNRCDIIFWLHVENFVWAVTCENIQITWEIVPFTCKEANLPLFHVPCVVSAHKNSQQALKKKQNKSADILIHQWKKPIECEDGLK